jgi:hypothetical protein
MSSTRQGRGDPCRACRAEEKVECAQAAATGGHVEHAPLLGGHHDQVLEEALGLDIGGEFLDEEVAVVLADIGFGQAQLAERDHLDIVHGGAPESRTWPSPSAHPFQPPSPHGFRIARLPVGH